MSHLSHLLHKGTKFVGLLQRLYTPPVVKRNAHHAPRPVPPQRPVRPRSPRGARQRGRGRGGGGAGAGAGAGALEREVMSSSVRKFWT